MRARVTTFYRLLGVASLPNDGNLDLFEDQGLSVRIYLTMNAQPVNDLLNMASAAGTVAFAHFTGALSGDTPPERYQSAIALLAKRNPPAPSGAVLMVVEVDGDGADPPKDQLLDLGGLAVWLGRAEKKAFDETASAFFRRAIVALALGLGGQVLPVFQKIGSVIYLIEADTNRRIFPVTISASGRATLATSISVATATDITTHYLPALSSATNLDSVIQLLGQSHDDDADTLRAFLTVWTALEMLIEKGFRTYKAEFFKILGMAVPMGAAIAWQRIQNLRDGNYPLLDKFAVMAAVLEPEDPADDFREFEKIKNARDPLYHEMKGDVEALPVAATRRLLVEYVRLHLTHAGKARS